MPNAYSAGMRALLVAALLLAGCSGAEMAERRGLRQAQEAESFCVGIGIPKTDSRFAECAMRFRATQVRGVPAPPVHVQSAPPVSAGPKTTCHQVGTMVQCY